MEALRSFRTHQSALKVIHLPTFVWASAACLNNSDPLRQGLDEISEGAPWNQVERCDPLVIGFFQGIP